MISERSMVKLANDLDNIQEVIELAASNIRTMAGSLNSLLEEVAASRIAANPNQVMKLQNQVVELEKRNQTLELLISTYETKNRRKIK